MKSFKKLTEEELSIIKGGMDINEIIYLEALGRDKEENKGLAPVSHDLRTNIVA